MSTSAKKVFCVAGAMIAFIIICVLGVESPTFVSLGAFVGVCLSFVSGYFMGKFNCSEKIEELNDQITKLSATVEMLEAKQK